MKNFSGKRVYITGGSSGIGLAVAREFSSKGAHVAIFARRRNELETAKGLIEDAKADDSQKVYYDSMDVSDNMDVKKVISSAVSDFGTPDILINSAGTGSAKVLEDMYYDEFKRVLDINLTGTRNVIKAILPSMKESGGSIVNVSSVAGLIPVYGYTAYGASKYAVNGFTECLRAELKGYGIKVSVLCPQEAITPLVEEESKTIPPETRFLKNFAGTVSAEFIAEELMKGLAKNRFRIIPGLRPKLIYYTRRFTPGFIERFLTDIIIRFFTSKNENKNYQESA